MDGVIAIMMMAMIEGTVAGAAAAETSMTSMFYIGTNKYQDYQASSQILLMTVLYVGMCMLKMNCLSVGR